MSILDDKLYFSKVRALTVDEVSDYYLDVKKIKEIGKGSPIYINVDVCTAFTSTNYGVLDIWLCTTTKAPTSVHRISEISASDLNAVGLAATKGRLRTVGKKVKVPLPSMNLKSHISLHYEVTGSGLVSGAVNAYLTLG